MLSQKFSFTSHMVLVRTFPHNYTTAKIIQCTSSILRLQPITPESWFESKPREDTLAQLLSYLLKRFWILFNIFGFIIFYVKIQPPLWLNSFHQRPLLIKCEYLLPTTIWTFLARWFFFKINKYFQKCWFFKYMCISEMEINLPLVGQRYDRKKVRK